MMFCRLVPTLAFLILLPATVLAHDFSAGDITVNHPWSMPLPPVSANGAAYITIENKGTETDNLVSASSPIADAVEVHEHLHEDGAMKMQQVEDLEVAGGETVSFSPGGLHLMLIGLKEPLVEGEKFHIELQFARAGKLEVMVHVENKSSGEMKNEEMGHASHSNSNSQAE